MHQRLGRVRGADNAAPDAIESASSFAEFFLAAGVEALVGTYWTVADLSAAHFVARAYRELANGETLDHAVRAGRQELHGKGAKDWANDVQYGDGRFRLFR